MCRSLWKNSTKRNFRNPPKKYRKLSKIGIDSLGKSLYNARDLEKPLIQNLNLDGSLIELLALSILELFLNFVNVFRQESKKLEVKHGLRENRCLL